MFRAHVLIIRRSKLHYTASGIITHIGGRLLHRLREDERWPPIGVMIPDYCDTIGNRTLEILAAYQNLVYCDNICRITINVAIFSRQSTVQNGGFLNFQYPSKVSRSNGAPKPIKWVKIICLCSASRSTLKGWNERGVSCNHERHSYRNAIEYGHLTRFIARMSLMENKNTVLVGKSESCTKLRRYKRRFSEDFKPRLK